MKRLFAVVLLLPLAGCRADLGEADPEAAREVVYDQNGVPAFAGQALMIQSCGAGGYCHAGSEIPLESRYGAPVGLDFDVRPAATTIEVDEAANQRLSAAQLQVLGMAGQIWEQVVSGRMPPDGEVGAEYADAVAALRYDRVADDGHTFTPLPGVDTDEGREILRNWLAAGAPLIERTQPRADRVPPTIGACVGACARTCVDVTWDSIYTQIIRPTCALSNCHSHENPQAELDLLGEATLSDPPTLEGARVVRSRLLEAEVRGPLCESEEDTMLAPGDPEGSLFHRKVAATSSEEVCGAPMPAAGSPLTEQQVCAIREWIACGACAEPDDAECADCVEAARATCGVGAAFDPSVGSAACAEAPSCANEVSPDSCPAI